MMKPSINKAQYNQNLDHIISSNTSLNDLLELLTKESMFNEFAYSRELINQIQNGKTHLLNLNILLKNLKR